MPDPRAISAIVLAAGSSSRFGADKLQHPVTLHGVTLPLAAHSLLPWLAVFAQITVVVRADSQKLCTTLETVLGARRAAAIRWLICADAAQGMGSSLACGVQANRHAGGWLIGLADMPAVSHFVISDVRSALLEGAGLAAPFCAGRRGHPVGFAAHYREELLALYGDKGARGLLERDESRVVHINTEHAGMFADIDIPADLPAL